MIEDKKTETNTIDHNPNQKDENSVVLRVPKPNLQIAVLGLVAGITLFQTLQLVRISSSAGSVSVKTAPAVATTTTTTNSGSTGTGSNANVPQSMVGGC